MRISVLGAGRWGAFLARYAWSIGHKVSLWGRCGSVDFQELQNNRVNDYLQLPEEILLTDSLATAVAHGEIILIAIPSQQLRSLARQLATLRITRKILVLCMKGIEIDSGKRLSQVVKEEVQSPLDVAIWVGPGHVQDYMAGIPNCMVIGSENISCTKMLVEALGSELIRLYYGQDIIGNEIGAAAKNVIGIAAGILDGLQYSSLKGALMARGAREIARLVRSMGGNELTVYGLSHLGDYSATLFSPYSHNRAFGEGFVKGECFTKLAEGVYTAKALHALAKRYELELPICTAIYHTIYETRDPNQVLLDFFLRPVKFEF